MIVLGLKKQANYLTFC